MIASETHHCACAGIPANRRSPIWQAIGERTASSISWTSAESTRRRTSSMFDATSPPCQVEASSTACFDRVPPPPHYLASPNARPLLSNAQSTYSHPVANDRVGRLLLCSAVQRCLQPVDRRRQKCAHPQPRGTYDRDSPFSLSTNPAVERAVGSHHSGIGCQVAAATRWLLDKVVPDLALELAFRCIKIKPDEVCTHHQGPCSHCVTPWKHRDGVLTLRGLVPVFLLRRAGD